LVLEQVADGRHSYQRITHVFERNIYVMRASTPEEARNARRPRRLPRAAVENQVELGVFRLGRLKLPSEFTRAYPSGSEEDLEVQHRKGLIEPLLSVFKLEPNLLRTSFTARIIERAVELMMSEVTLRRLLLRYWYFGGADQCLLPLRPGPAEGSIPANVAEEVACARKRPGRKHRLVVAEEYPDIAFIPGEPDFVDMIGALTRKARRSPTTWVDAHEEYLKVEFATRHPQLARDYIDGKILCPVSLRQFTRIIKEHEALSESLRENVLGLRGNRSQRALHSTGPGDVYEVDATGGQIYLVDSRDPARVLAHPTIYVLIDRWSRFIVGIYVTLGPPSWQALRMLLRISFTSRTERFKLLGFAIDDERWPVAVPPAQLATDRGAEMISWPMLKAAAEGLLIEPLVLPPLTPDGKAIVERVIRTLKDKLRARGTRGVHEKNVLGPKATRRIKQARQAAVLSLTELYRVLVKIVDEYNHKPHRSLRKRAELRQAGVPPIPADAYVWGLANLTGIQRPPLSEDDYFRLTLEQSTASLADRVLRHRGWRYFPDNDAARRIARRSSSRAHSHDVAVDHSLPTTIHSFGSSNEEWPRWRIEPAGRAWYERMTFEEEEGLADEHALVVAKADHEALRARVAEGVDRPAKRVATRRHGSDNQGSEGDHARRRRESAALDGKLSGQAQRPRRSTSPASDATAIRARQLDQEEEAALIARSRSKRPT
jgi:hypothetical protein